MKTCTKLFVAMILLAATQIGFAQDIHLSQFYSQPLMVNPAMTGNLNGSYRAGLTYRNQWASIPAPYETFVLGFDMSLLSCQLGGDHVGAGVVLYRDQSGDGVLTETSALASLAYHKALDQEAQYVLSLGGQFGYTQKSVDFTRLTFDSQIEDYQINSALPNNESIDNDQFSYMDLRLGGLFTASVNETVSLYAGGAYNHATKPVETFLTAEGEKNQLSPRLVLHGGGSIFVNDQFSISPSVMYMSQASNTLTILGAAFGYHFDSGRYDTGSALYLGGWYRANDAIVMLLGIDFSSFKFGFSYDINVSDLERASNGQGAAELSLTYSGKTADCKPNRKIYCPRF
ncbi:MAG: PorP/SprF family type IX secretion system membrane protein [Chitinophagales bacterium]